MHNFSEGITTKNFLLIEEDESCEGTANAFCNVAKIGMSIYILLYIYTPLYIYIYIYISICICLLKLYFMSVHCYVFLV